MKTTIREAVDRRVSGEEAVASLMIDEKSIRPLSTSVTGPGGPVERVTGIGSRAVRV